MVIIKTVHCIKCKARTIKSQFINDVMNKAATCAYDLVNFSSSCCVTQGTVYSSSSGKSEPPFSPQSIPYWVSYNKMLYFWVTKYSFNSLLYQAHRNGDLKYKGTKSNVSIWHTHAAGVLCPQLFHNNSHWHEIFIFLSNIEISCPSSSFS